MRDRFIRAAILAGVAALGLLAPAPGSAKDPASLRLWISLRHPGVGWVTTGELAASLEGADAPTPLHTTASGNATSTSRCVHTTVARPPSKGRQSCPTAG